MLLYHRISFVNLPLQLIQNHSEPKLGTENTPQWIKIPTLASSYQSGNGLLSKLSHVGSYPLLHLTEYSFANVKFKNINDTKIVPRDFIFICQITAYKSPYIYYVISLMLYLKCKFNGSVLIRGLTFQIFKYLIIFFRYLNKPIALGTFMQQLLISTITYTVISKINL